MRKSFLENPESPTLAVEMVYMLRPQKFLKKPESPTLFKARKQLHLTTPISRLLEQAKSIAGSCKLDL